MIQVPPPASWKAPQVVIDVSSQLTWNQDSLGVCDLQLTTIILLRGSTSLHQWNCQGSLLVPPPRYNYFGPLSSVLATSAGCFRGDDSYSVPAYSSTPCSPMNGAGGRRMKRWFDIVNLFTGTPHGLRGSVKIRGMLADGILPMGS